MSASKPTNAGHESADLNSFTKGSTSKSSIRLASKKFLINKKRQLLDKVSKRTSKTINDISHSCGELSKSVSKLYANVLIDADGKVNSKNKMSNPDLASVGSGSIRSRAHTPVSIHPTPIAPRKKKFSLNSLDRLELDDDEDDNESRITKKMLENTISSCATSTFSNLVISNSRNNRHRVSARPRRPTVLDTDMTSMKEVHDEDDPDRESSLTDREHYINETFFEKSSAVAVKLDKTSPPRRDKTSGGNRKKATPNMDPDHFYNEINETDGKAGNANGRGELSSRAQRNNELMTTTKTTKVRKHTGEVAQITATMTTTLSRTTNANLSASLVASEAAAGSGGDDISAKNLAFKKNIASIAKLKSPERKILYNEWFTIIKKMEKDPKFDLEALVRTRGRFTEHDHIAYRDKLLEKQHQRLRCARSEPNFHTMMSTAQSSSGLNGLSTDPNLMDDKLMMNKKNNRGGINTAPAVNRGAHRKDNMNGSSQDLLLFNVDNNKKLKRNFSENAHDFHAQHQQQQSNFHNTISSNSSRTNLNRNCTIRSQSISESNLIIPRNLKNLFLGAADSDSYSLNGSKQNNNAANKQDDLNSASLSTALKLTLQKSDINFIKEILKKKDKNAISEIGLCTSFFNSNF